MESELQFFMTEKDQAEFLAYAETLFDRMSKSKDNTHRLQIGNCAITFTPSPFEKNIMYTGKLRINTIDEHGQACNNEEQTKKAYRQLKKWIKKNYWSRLAFLDKNKKDKLTPSRAYFLGPDAKKWKDSNPGKHKLKLSATSWMVFEIGI